MSGTTPKPAPKARRKGVPAKRFFDIRGELVQLKHIDVQVGDPEIGALVAALSKLEAQPHDVADQELLERRLLERAIVLNPMLRICLRLDGALTVAAIANNLNDDDRGLLIAAARSSVVEAIALTDLERPVNLTVSAPNAILIQWSTPRGAQVNEAASAALDAVRHAMAGRAPSDQDRRDTRDAEWMRWRLEGLTDLEVATRWANATDDLSATGSTAVALSADAVAEWRNAGGAHEDFHDTSSHVSRQLKAALGRIGGTGSDT
jgi:hypothetical protein